MSHEPSVFLEHSTPLLFAIRIFSKSPCTVLSLVPNRKGNWYRSPAIRGGLAYPLQPFWKEDLRNLQDPHPTHWSSSSKGGWYRRSSSAWGPIYGSEEDVSEGEKSCPARCEGGCRILSLWSSDRHLRNAWWNMDVLGHWRKTRKLFRMNKEQ